MRIIAVLFAIFWVSVVTIDYVNKHPGYFTSLEYFRYPKLLIFVLSTILILIWHLKFDKVIKFKLPVNGISISLLTLIFSISISFAHQNYSYTPTSIQQVFHSVKWGWEVIIVIFIIVMVLHSIGQYAYRLLLAKRLDPNPILNIAFGIILFVFVLFVIGIFKQLSPNTVLATLFVFSLLNLFDLVKSFKRFFLKSINIDDYSWLGVLSFCFLLFFLVLNFQTSIGPFPTGFDSRNVYVNISKLIADSGGLVGGFQPYNWSIFMGVGFLLFDKVELALGISYLGIVLSLFAAFQLAKKLLKLDVNLIMLMLAVFVVTPAITNQMTVELKVDFGMLFFQILTVYYAIILFRKLEVLDFQKDLSTNIKSLMPLIIIMGMLSGFGLGIKMINMFLVFALLILLWWDNNNKVAVFGILCFAIAGSLLAGIDTISGLNSYHLSGNIIKYLLGGLSIVALGVSFYQQKKNTILRFIVTAFFLFFTGIMIVPWIVKNYSESKSLDSKSLLMGKEPGPNITLIQMIKKYEKSRNK